MRMTPRDALIFGGLLVTLLPLSAGAQETAQSDSIQSEMRSALRALASAQIWYYEEHKTYTDDIDALKQAPGCKVPEGVLVGITFAEQGWAMESRHPNAPGQSCVYWFGVKGEVPEILTAGRNLKGSSTPGRVICDFDPSPPQGGNH